MSKLQLIEENHCENCYNTNLICTEEGDIVCQNCGFVQNDEEIINKHIKTSFYQGSKNEILNNQPIYQYKINDITNSFQKQYKNTTIGNIAHFLKRNHIALQDRQSKLLDIYEQFENQLHELRYFNELIDIEIKQKINLIFQKNASAFRNKPGEYSIKILYILAGYIHLKGFPSYFDKIFVEDVSKLFPDVKFLDFNNRIYKTVKEFGQILQIKTDPLIKLIHDFHFLKNANNNRIDYKGLEKINSFINIFNPIRLLKRTENEFSKAAKIKSQALFHLDKKQYLLKRKMLNQTRNSLEYYVNAYIYYILNKIKQSFDETTIKLKREFILLFSTSVYDILNDLKRNLKDFIIHNGDFCKYLQYFLKMDFSKKTLETLFDHPLVTIKSMNNYRRKRAYQTYFRIFELNFIHNLKKDFISSEANNSKCELIESNTSQKTAVIKYLHGNNKELDVKGNNVKNLLTKVVSKLIPAHQRFFYLVPEIFLDNIFLFQLLIKRTSQKELIQQIESEVSIFSGNIHSIKRYLACEIFRSFPRLKLNH